MTGIDKFLKLFFLILLVQLSFKTVKSQAPIKLRSTLSISGSSKTISFQDKHFLVQQSIGQSSVIGLSQGIDYLLRQGFIQPLKGSNNGIASENLQVTVSPNPFPGEVTVSFTEMIWDDLYISLCDLNGRTVYSNKHAAAQEINLNFGSLQPALYIIRVYTNKKYYISKLIKE